MLIDFLIYGLFICGLAAALNISIFRKQPATRKTAWALTVGIFFVNAIAWSVLQLVRFRFLSQDLGLEIKPDPSNFLGSVTVPAFAGCWLFFGLLRKFPRHTEISYESGTSFVESSEFNHNSQPLQKTKLLSAIAVSTPPRAAPMTAPQRIPIDEDRIYALIAEELETGTPEKGLWTRLFAECGGEEKQLKVLYIRQRAERLIAAERARLEQTALEGIANAERRVELSTVEPASSTESEYTHEIPEAPLTVKSCPSCRAINAGDLITCFRCGTLLPT
jgi:hypothetical protein